MKRVISFILLVFIILSSVCAFDSVENYFSNLKTEEVEELKKGNSLEVRTPYNDLVYDYAYPGSWAYDICYKAAQADLSFTVGISRFVPYPESFKNMSEEAIKLNVFNKLLKISTLKDIKYVSFRSGNKLKTLFTEAVMLSEPKISAKIDDPQVSAIPSAAKYYACLTDTKFLANIYSADYRAVGDEMMIEITNCKKISYMGRKCVDPEGLHMYVDIEFLEEGVLVFGFATCFDTESTIDVLFTSVSLDGAFNTRIRALKDWFVKQMED